MTATSYGQWLSETRNAPVWVIDKKVNRTSELLCPLTGLGNAVGLHDRLSNICGMIVTAESERVQIIAGHKQESESVSYIRAKNIHPLSLMLIEIDQLSSKINLSNRPSEHLKRSSKYSDPPPDFGD